MLGLPFAFAHHFSAHNTVPALDLYRRSFQPSEILEQPYSMIAAQVLCAEDDEQAGRLALPSLLSWIRLRQGRPSRVPTPQESEAHEWSQVEVAMAEDRLAGQAVGGPDTVRARLTTLIAETGIDELMITVSAYEQSDRIASLERTRALFGEESIPLGFAG